MIVIIVRRRPDGRSEDPTRRARGAAQDGTGLVASDRGTPHADAGRRRARSALRVPVGPSRGDAGRRSNDFSAPSILKAAPRRRRAPPWRPGASGAVEAPTAPVLLDRGFAGAGAATPPPSAHSPLPPHPTWLRGRGAASGSNGVPPGVSAWFHGDGGGRGSGSGLWVDRCCCLWVACRGARSWSISSWSISWCVVPLPPALGATPFVERRCGEG